MTRLPEEADGALAPLRAAIADAARSEARAVAAAARREVRSRGAAAAAEADRLRADAVRAGEDAAASEAGLLLARARRSARREVLAAEADAVTRFEEALAAAASRLRDDPEYPAILDRLRRRARHVLGDGARIEESAQGGVVAEAGTRRVDLRLPELAREEGREMLREGRTPWPAR